MLIKSVFDRHVGRHIVHNFVNDDFDVVKFSSRKFLGIKNIGFDTFFLMLPKITSDKIM